MIFLNVKRIKKKNATFNAIKALQNNNFCEDAIQLLLQKFQENITCEIISFFNYFFIHESCLTQKHIHYCIFKVIRIVLPCLKISFLYFTTFLSPFFIVLKIQQCCKKICQHFLRKDKYLIILKIILMEAWRLLIFRYLLIDKHFLFLPYFIDNLFRVS